MKSYFDFKYHTPDSCKLQKDEELCHLILKDVPRVVLEKPIQQLRGLYKGDNALTRLKAFVISAAIGCVDMVREMEQAKIVSDIYRFHLFPENPACFNVIGSACLQILNEYSDYKTKDTFHFCYELQSVFKYNGCFSALGFSDLFSPTIFFFYFTQLRAGFNGKPAGQFVDLQEIEARNDAFFNSPYIYPKHLDWSFISPFLENCNGVIRHEHFLMWLRTWLFGIVYRFRTAKNNPLLSMSSVTGSAVLHAAMGDFSSRGYVLKKVVENANECPAECLVDLCLLFPRLWSLNEVSV